MRASASTRTREHGKPKWSLPINSGNLVAVIALCTVVSILAFSGGKKPTVVPNTDLAAHPLFLSGALPVVYAKNQQSKAWDLEKALASGVYSQTKGGLVDEDRELLGKYYSQSDSVFEFGVGESSQMAAFLNIPRYTGVDTDMQWLQNIRSSIPGHFRLHFADIGVTGDFGNPVSNAGVEKYPFYSVAALAAEDEAFDFYMVDGRFRVASAAAAFLHASAHGRKPSEFFVAVHDFRERGDNQYFEVTKFGDLVDGFDINNPIGKVRIAIFRRNAQVTDQDLYKVWNEYKYNVE